MSQENVEIVRASFDAWNAGDMDAYRDLYDAHAVLRTPEGWPEPGPYFGREAVIRELGHMRSAWATNSAEVIGDFIDVADRVAVRSILHGVGQGPKADLELTTLFTVRKGKILALEVFWHHAEVLHFLGLEE